MKGRKVLIWGAILGISIIFGISTYGNEVETIPHNIISVVSDDGVQARFDVDADMIFCSKLGKADADDFVSELKFMGDTYVRDDSSIFYIPFLWKNGTTHIYYKKSNF